MRFERALPAPPRPAEQAQPADARAARRSDRGQFAGHAGGVRADRPGVRPAMSASCASSPARTAAARNWSPRPSFATPPRGRAVGGHQRGLAQPFAGRERDPRPRPQGVAGAERITIRAVGTSRQRFHLWRQRSGRHPPGVASELLRSLEHGLVLPVETSSRCRAISASSWPPVSNLCRAQVADASFRHDLYFRLVTLGN